LIPATEAALNLTLSDGTSQVTMLAEQGDAVQVVDVFDDRVFTVTVTRKSGGRRCGCTRAGPDPRPQEADGLYAGSRRCCCRRRNRRRPGRRRRAARCEADLPVRLRGLTFGSSPVQANRRKTCTAAAGRIHHRLQGRRPGSRGRLLERRPGHAPGRRASDHYLKLDASARDLAVEVQRVPHESRVHLDIESDDVEAEVARLQALGARRLDSIKTWVVLEAPTGQRFCVIRARSFPVQTSPTPPSGR
jgi:hypothetical protein